MEWTRHLEYRADGLHGTYIIICDGSHHWIVFREFDSRRKTIIGNAETLTEAKDVCVKHDRRLRGLSSDEPPSNTIEMQP